MKKLEHAIESLVFFACSVPVLSLLRLNPQSSNLESCRGEYWGSARVCGLQVFHSDDDAGPGLYLNILAPEKSVDSTS